MQEVVFCIYFIVVIKDGSKQKREEETTKYLVQYIQFSILEFCYCIIWVSEDLQIKEALVINTGF